jgi:hypothetical protein
VIEARDFSGAYQSFVLPPSEPQALRDLQSLDNLPEAGIPDRAGFARWVAAARVPGDLSARYLEPMTGEGARSRTRTLLRQSGGGVWATLGPVLPRSCRRMAERFPSLYGDRTRIAVVRSVGGERPPAAGDWVTPSPAGTSVENRCPRGEDTEVTFHLAMVPPGGDPDRFAAMVSRGGVK